MKQEDIQQGMAEIYHYSCRDCGQGNLSRDEVIAADHGYICLKCLSNEIDKIK